MADVESLSEKTVHAFIPPDLSEEQKIKGRIANEWKII